MSFYHPKIDMSKIPPFFFTDLRAYKSLLPLQHVPSCLSVRSRYYAQGMTSREATFDPNAMAIAFDLEAV